MNLENKIMNDIKQSMLAKDSLRLEVLRAIKSERLGFTKSPLSNKNNYY